jgi:hypothetical protein
MQKRCKEHAICIVTDLGRIEDVFFIRILFNFSKPRDTSARMVCIVLHLLIMCTNKLKPCI